MGSAAIKILILGLLFFHSLFAYSQEKCATIHLKINQNEPEAQFEDWISKKIEEKPQFGIQGTYKTKAVVQIPVVVHIIHRGESIGDGTNISYDQIKSQIDVLNEDFRRLNADAANTPDVFQSVAADLEVEFILAKQDPEGLPTDGIVRVDGNQSSWDVAEINEMSALSYWPAEDYLNIWVTNLSGGYLGFAQFPVSDLQGLENANHNRLTDGVAIDYMAFGSEEKFPAANLDSQYNLGRTTTHEVGHFLGLRHIWGDGGCNADDYVADTPSASANNANYGGACTFPGPNSCDQGDNDLPDMFQNFMDYTDDKCMNIFTQDQKARVLAVLAESPRRASLTTSPGLEEPQLAALDLGIRNIITPNIAACGDEIQPVLEIRNYGEEEITDFQIDLYLNNVITQSLTFTGISLSSLEIDTLIFSPQGISPDETIQLSFEISSVNGTTDYINGNNIAIEVPYYNIRQLPLIEDFESFSLENWEIFNYDGGATWSVQNAPFIEESNKALATNFYNDENVGETDILLSMPLFIPDDSTALLSFYLAYARYNLETQEGLVIKVSDNCGNTFNKILYEKYGADLQTVSPTTSKFVPSNINDWRQEVLDLSEFRGKHIRISFAAINEYGNNLYLDNIQLISSNITDLELSGIVNPTPAQCNRNINPVLLIKNNGTGDISSASIEMDVNGFSNVYRVEFQNSLPPGAVAEIEFPQSSSSSGDNEIAFEVVSVNDNELDFYGFNNIISRSFIIDESSEELPLREDFEDFENSKWQILNMDDDITWEVSRINGNSYASFPSSTYKDQRDEDWIISPLLDFSEVEEASLTFDLSYSGNQTDRLKILYSDDCGDTYKPLNYDKSGNLLNTAGAVRREYQSLEDLIGLSDIRIAIVASGSRGKNIDIDNIEIFLEDIEAPFKFEQNVVVHPNPAHEITNITFSLKQKDDVRITVTDQSGRIFSTYSFRNILNQTHRINVSGLSQGVYFIKIEGETFQDIKKLVLF